MADTPDAKGEDDKVDQDETDGDGLTENKAPEGGGADPAPEPDLDAALAASPLVAAEIASDDPEPTQDDLEDVEEDHHHADNDADHHATHHRSFAARALTWLLLLLAGGGVALWGAPRIAPHLPDGLGPVKAWLMPGELQSRRDIAALRSELEERVAAIDTSLDEARVSEIASDALAGVQNDLIGEITSLDARVVALSDQVGAADSADVEARLGALEAKVEGLVAQVEGLSVMDIDGLSEDQAEALAGFAAAVEGVRGELAEVAARQGKLSQRVDEVEVSVNRKLEDAEAEVAAVQQEASKAQSVTVIRASLSTIESALAAGDNYESALADLDAETELDIPSALSATAATGVTPLGALRSSFADAAHAAIRAEIRSGESEGVASRLSAFVESQIASRSLSPREGDDADAILSRAEDALRRDNLAAAVEELAGLQDVSREAMAGWISKAEARVAAMTAFADLKASLTAQN